MRDMFTTCRRFATIARRLLSFDAMRHAADIAVDAIF